MKLTKKEIEKYKEVMISKFDNRQIYYFKLKVENMSTSTLAGFYCIDQDDKKWISVCAISQLIKESDYEKFNCRYFDINPEKQMCFYSLADLISFLDLFPEAKENSTTSTLMSLIQPNTRQGTPRKFIHSTDGERINIEFVLQNSVKNILN